MASDLKVMPQHHQLVIDLEESIGCCRMLIKSMDDQISEFDWNDTDALNISIKIKVVFESKISEDFRIFIDRVTSAFD